uniref:(northern house mosquito) hypothetical protein n=1 Tax=Culex pipiens TaxID=7175 RepID=A0A8D8CQP7_CULPI
MQSSQQFVAFVFGPLKITSFDFPCPQSCAQENPPFGGKYYNRQNCQVDAAVASRVRTSSTRRRKNYYSFSNRRSDRPHVPPFRPASRATRPTGRPGPERVSCRWRKGGNRWADCGRFCRAFSF